MKCYATVDSLRTALAIGGPESDERLRTALEKASAIIDTLTGRRFDCQEGIRYFDAADPLVIDDCLSISEFKTDEDGDLDYEATLSSSTDYLLWPWNRFPKRQVHLHPTSSRSGFGAGLRSAKITGVWGYGDSATPYKDAGATVATILAAATSLTPSTLTPFSAGQTIRIESEQLYVVTKGPSLTIERGVNGTVAADHTSKPISIYQYPGDIVGLCLSLAARIINLEGHGGLSSERLGDYSYQVQNDLTDPEKAVVSSYQEGAID
jgi:hypothetical protein